MPHFCSVFFKIFDSFLVSDHEGGKIWNYDHRCLMLNFQQLGSNGLSDVWTDRPIMAPFLRSLHT